MKKLNTLIWKLRIYKDTRGQDLIEYALMVGFIAVAAGAVIPGVVTSMRNIFNTIAGVLDNSANAASGGSNP
jgi:pilus assembly protein Flp/PilA